MAFAHCSAASMFEPVLVPEFVGEDVDEQVLGRLARVAAGDVVFSVHAEPDRAVAGAGDQAVTVPDCSEVLVDRDNGERASLLTLRRSVPPPPSCSCVEQGILSPRPAPRDLGLDPIAGLAGRLSVARERRSALIPDRCELLGQVRDAVSAAATGRQNQPQSHPSSHHGMLGPASRGVNRRSVPPIYDQPDRAERLKRVHKNVPP